MTKPLFFKRVVLFTLLILSSQTKAVAFQTAEGDFKSFISLFKKAGAVDSLPPALSEERVRAFMPISEVREGRKFYPTALNRKNSRFYEVMVDYDCPGLAHCEGTFLITYNLEGKYLGHFCYFKFEGNELDYVYRSCPIRSNDFLVAVEYRLLGGTFNYDESRTPHLVEDVVIRNSGKIEVLVQRKIPRGRKHALASVGLINDLDLDLLSKDEVLAMKNEIYASYGLVFEERKWQKYFGRQKWYKPVVDEVPDAELTALERRNLRIINAYLKKQ